MLTRERETIHILAQVVRLNPSILVASFKPNRDLNIYCRPSLWSSPMVLLLIGVPLLIKGHFLSTVWVYQLVARV
jgi:hypothetical protein